MEIRTQKCDGENCGKLRIHDSNHWLIGWSDNGRIEVCPMTDTILREVDDKGKHFCGERCLTKWFLTELGKLKGA